MNKAILAVMQVGLLLALFALWHVLVKTEVLPPFFFGEPLTVLQRAWDWFATGKIFPHLGITLLETLLAFAIGTALGLVVGLWLALSELASKLLDPYITRAQLDAAGDPGADFRGVVRAWNLVEGAARRDAGILIVFFSVYHGVREVSPTVLANARMLGASGQQLLRHVYLPSATAWVFSSLHASVGMAFVGAVVGEYLGSAKGVGYLILQAEGVFDINTVFAGVLVLTACALVLDRIVTLAERRLLRWAPRQRLRCLLTTHFEDQRQPRRPQRKGTRKDRVW